jgi:hypothetical protein
MLCMAFDYPRPMLPGRRRCEINLITFKPDGTDIRCALGSRPWRRRTGNHPCWCPDGEHITMNLGQEAAKTPHRYSLTRLRYDGEGLVPMTTVPGSGHPSLHRDGRHMIADTYQGELPGPKDGTVPIRWIDAAKNTERTLIRINSSPAYIGPGSALRLDPHPAWDRTYTRVAINACPTGTRRVYIADIPRELF